MNISAFAIVNLLQYLCSTFIEKYGLRTCSTHVVCVYASLFSTYLEVSTHVVCAHVHWIHWDYIISAVMRVICVFLPVLTGMMYCVICRFKSDYKPTLWLKLKMLSKGILALHYFCCTNGQIKSVALKVLRQCKARANAFN